MQLPKPDSDALEHSKKLELQIYHEIKQSGEMISFARFMELALYTPGLGYYCTGNHKLGAGGDFVTAPEISPLFAQCVARQYQQLFNDLQSRNIRYGETHPEESISTLKLDVLEFGAGSGVFAKDFMLELEKLNAVPDTYFILEVSAELRERQQLFLQQHCPHIFNKFVWLNNLPTEPINGMIFANEVMDALPVNCFQIQNNQIMERTVGWENDRFIWRDRSNPELSKQVQRVMNDCFNIHSTSDVSKIYEDTTVETNTLSNHYHFTYNPHNNDSYHFTRSTYHSEICLMLPAWIRSITNILNAGLILLSDYGYGRQEYYHPDRSMGTLMCYYRHHRHTDPFYYPGLQDITAHVDFTTVIESANDQGCQLAGYTTQTGFLLNCGLLEIAAQSAADPIKMNQQIKILTLPSQMGESIKVMGLAKNIEGPLLGFLSMDRSRDL